MPPADIEGGRQDAAASVAGECERLLARPPVVAGLAVQSAASASSTNRAASASQHLQAWFTGRGRLRGPPTAAVPVAPLPRVPDDVTTAEQLLQDECHADLSLRTRMTLLVCLVFVSAALTQYIDAAQLQVLIEGLQSAPLGSVLICIVLFAAAVVLLLPGMLLSVGAGAAYGLNVGFAVAWCGTVLGQIGAFVLGRYLLRDVVYSYMVKRVPHFAKMDNNISADGWKLVLLLRLSPVLPYNIMNYVLGLTSIGLWPYALASAAAAVPYVCLFVYLGSISSDVYSLLISPSGALLSPGWLMFLACVMILSAIGLFYTCKHAITHTQEVDLQCDVLPTAAVAAGEAAGRRHSAESGST